MEQRRRIIAVFIVLGLGFGSVAVRLAYLQIYEHAKLTARAEEQQERIMMLPAKRGTIFDRTGTALAVSLDVDSVYGVPSQVTDPAKLARRLARILDESPRTLERKLDSDRHFVWLTRKVGPTEADRVRRLGSREVRLRLEPRRFYPQKTLAGVVIGFTGMDNTGLEGIEREYDNELQGKSGWVLAEKDAQGATVFPGGPGLQYKLPRTGSDIVLTIDAVLQHIADKELNATVDRTRAKGGVCIVMDPHTGEILALAVRAAGRNRLPFNPNDAPSYRPGEWRDRAVTDSFEPGSIFKPFLAAAAIAEKTVHPFELFDCSAGKIRIADRTIKDAEEHGVLSFTDVIAESSNVGTIQAALRLGKERFYSYITAFGFGSRTGVDLPGEVDGLLRPPGEWSPVALGEIAIGQAVGVTPIQMATAYCALANGGVLMKPYVVSKIVGHNGAPSTTFYPQPERRVISAETCRKVDAILRQVVAIGTGVKAQPVGYTAAGKTGTAQKVDHKTGEYSDKNYVSSFVGFAPANAPRLVILVMVDSPEGPAWGGTVAAPVFKAVAEQGLAYLGVPPDDGSRTLLVTR